MSKGLWVGLVALSAVACAPNHVDLPATMSVSPEFSPEESESIFSAAEAWRKATHGVARIQLSVGYEGTIRVVPFDGASEDALAITKVDVSGAKMSIDCARVGREAHHFGIANSDYLQDTAMHELGHAFGLEHEPGGLMRPEGYAGAVVDEGSKRRFCDQYDCAATSNAEYAAD